MWNIVGTCNGTKEILDETNDFDEAQCLATEYQIAYGSHWLINIEKIGGRNVRSR